MTVIVVYLGCLDFGDLHSILIFDEYVNGFALGANEPYGFVSQFHDPFITTHLILPEIGSYWSLAMEFLVLIFLGCISDFTGDI